MAVYNLLTNDAPILKVKLSGISEGLDMTLID